MLLLFTPPPSYCEACSATPVMHLKIVKKRKEKNKVFDKDKLWLRNLPEKMSKMSHYLNVTVVAILLYISRLSIGIAIVLNRWWLNPIHSVRGRRWGDHLDWHWGFLRTVKKYKSFNWPISYEMQRKTQDLGKWLFLVFIFAESSVFTYFTSNTWQLCTLSKLRFSLLGTLLFVSFASPKLSHSQITSLPWWYWPTDSYSVVNPSAYDRQNKTKHATQLPILRQFYAKAKWSHKQFGARVRKLVRPTISSARKFLWSLEKLHESNTTECRKFHDFFSRFRYPHLSMELLNLRKPS